MCDFQSAVVGKDWAGGPLPPGPLLLLSATRLQQPRGQLRDGGHHGNDDDDDDNDDCDNTDDDDDDCTLQEWQRMQLHD